MIEKWDIFNKGRVNFFLFMNCINMSLIFWNVRSLLTKLSFIIFSLMSNENIILFLYFFFATIILVIKKNDIVAAIISNILVGGIEDVTPFWQDGVLRHPSCLSSILLLGEMMEGIFGVAILFSGGEGIDRVLSSHFLVITKVDIGWRILLGWLWMTKCNNLTFGEAEPIIYIVFGGDRRFNPLRTGVNTLDIHPICLQDCGYYKW